ncbi:NAD kinase [Salirhabdus salicampi]|uniref:NAD kinase n=1 Tax=Salirhabdus salicampi TaxID=476102 RepID=UPI0020C4318D|nr:NAD kinase [Salirhabdus salicampi]MCP8617125.1 NAD kinase [Salirhabdus salicampi]
MDERNNLYFYYQKEDELENQIQALFRVAEENGFQLVEDHHKANIIVSVGGDGTFLQAVRKTGFRQDCLYMGINQADAPSLYGDFHLNTFQEMVDVIKNQNIEVRRFPVIDVKINDDITSHCLNELSIRSALIKSIVMDVFIDDQHFEKFRGDGLIVATPTGSTGYNKSTHGAVVDPKLPCIQVTELASLNNNQFRTLGSSFILSGDRKLKLEIVQDGNDHPIIGLDNEAFPIQTIKQVEIALSDKMIKTVKLKDNSYWDRVKRTFL